MAKIQKPHRSFVDCVIITLCKLLTLACNYYSEKHWIFKLMLVFYGDIQHQLLWFHAHETTSIVTQWPHSYDSENKYLTVGSTIITAIDRTVYMYGPLPIQPNLIL